ncbi:SRPBCC domain-containing protein [Microbacterium sp. SS28]|uniref:SRPBCC domain-containing protein n=1 Tax=Microbacterium sp. SS28 TaxID=2919948 RepID=UPI001FA97A59|nr:SRPBCC domain-containing protein [Microbacterium sp. SS28]
MNPELDLEITRVIRAPRSAVWRAWTDPDQLSRWFIPAPMVSRVDSIDLRPGGGLVTSFGDAGASGDALQRHIDAVFLVVEDESHLVWTNAIDSAWRPQQPQPVALTTDIHLLDHPDGTDYRVVVRHGTREDRDRHESLGFFEGWGAVTDQLAALVEQDA